MSGKKCVFCVCVCVDQQSMKAHGSHAHTHTLCASEGSHSDPAGEQLNYKPDKPNERKKKEKAPLVVHRRQSPSVFFTVCLQLVSESEDLRLQSEGTVCPPPSEPGKHCDSAADIKTGLSARA